MGGFLKEYTVLAELGQGGFAKVYKVRHNTLGYIRAIRVLNEPVTDENSPVYLKFLRECKVLLRLGNGIHRNIVHIYQPRLLDNHALVEMDYVDGKDLAHYLKDNGNWLPIDEVLRMVEQMSDALAYCHEDIYKFCLDPDEDQLKNDPVDGSKWIIDETLRERLVEKYKVIHNDIHSGNIMRREDGSFVLLDFGLAITGGDDVRNSSRHDNGAIEFKAPEKWVDEAILTEQSDIYSFGVVMYEYLAGRVPFPFDKGVSRTEAEFKLLKAHKEQAPPPIHDLRKAYYEAKYKGETYHKDYPDWLEEAIMRCLEKDPAKRFRNGKELHEFVKRHLKEGVKNASDATHATKNESARRHDGAASLQEKGEQSNAALTKKWQHGHEKHEEHKQPQPDNRQQSKGHKSNRKGVLGFWIGLFIAVAFTMTVWLAWPKKNTDAKGKDQACVSEMANGDLIVTVNGVSFTMKPVAGGTFRMGSNDKEAYDWEKPVHSVTVNSFYMAETEVTQVLWKAVMGNNLGYDEGDNLPVGNVSWDDCQTFIYKLNELTGMNFRLPTEAEWEYAARGGNKAVGYNYAGSSNIDGVAWYDGNSGKTIHEVKTKMPNALGLYDMSGNVWEWCQDWYGYYSDKSQTDPQGPSGGTDRVLRGGSVMLSTTLCRVSHRAFGKPDGRDYDNGFRLVLSQ